MLITLFFTSAARNKVPGKTKEEHIREKKQELEKRLQDVSGQLGQAPKKSVKKGKLYYIIVNNLTICVQISIIHKHVRKFLDL